ncbi:RNA polymerase sigma factor [Granulicella sp. S190]|uniref:RNA polymerase sigma factor n=1 Tax=Granulicella sp. S190 TaxID=1747226 RepID=UPI00131C1BEA|nr:sigma-70 family RNA polymerase sigma factor [Granulicella sp. S190]
MHAAESISNLVLQRKEFLRFVQRRVASPAFAEDILQSAYARAVEQSSSLRLQESAQAWFYRILRNAVIDYYRHRSAEDRALELWARDLSEIAPDQQTEEIVCECIEQILPTLKPSYSEILREVDLADQSLEVFSRKSGITNGNAAVRIHRARQALKKQLLLICSLCARHGCVNCTCTKTQSSN